VRRLAASIDGSNPICTGASSRRRRLSSVPITWNLALPPALDSAGD
jgi:hypothetical protein